MSLKRLLQFAVVIQLFVMAAGLSDSHIGSWNIVMSTQAFNVLGWVVMALIVVAVLKAFAENAHETLF